MSKKHTIHAFFHTETEGMLETLKGMEIDVTKCHICNTPIVRTQRDPIYLTERWDAWRHKKKFYDWNIGAVSSKGVICDDFACFYILLEQQREVEIQAEIAELQKAG